MNKNYVFENLVIDFNSGVKNGAQAYLAKKAKIPTQTISAWINGRSVPTKAGMLQLAKVLKKDIKDIQKAFSTKISNDESGDKNINLKLLTDLIKKQNEIIEENKKYFISEINFLKEKIKSLENKI